jgi:hypothetical protein
MEYRFGCYRQLPFVLVLRCTPYWLAFLKAVMNSDNANDNMNSIPSVSLFRGIYNRVAKRLGVDPSYVSRVARGERKSAVVEKALAEEVRVIREHLNDHENNHSHNHNHNENHGSPNQTLDPQRKKLKVSPRKDSTLEV